MKRWMIATLAALSTWAILSPASAWAQIGYYNRPYYPKSTLSPYLNMFQGGNPAINYYGLVRPQVQTNQQLQTLQGDITQQQTMLAQPQQNQQGQPMPTTGHPVMFMNYSHYFPAMNRFGGGVGGQRQSPYTAGFIGR